MAEHARVALAPAPRHRVLRAFASALALVTLPLAFALGAACLVCGLSYWSFLFANARS